MFRIFFILVLLQFTFCAEPVDFFNKTYIEVIKHYGFPNMMFPVRQSTPEKDDIVFGYNYSYWYFFNNRLYRVFYSSKYPGAIYKDIKIGSPRSLLTKYFGSNYTVEKEGTLWTTKDKFLVVAKFNKNQLETLWLINKVEK